MNKTLVLLSVYLLTCSCTVKKDFKEEENRVQEVNIVDSLGRKQGLWVKEVGSNIIDTMYFSEGQLHGSYKSYFKSGALRHTGNYEHGVISGIWNYYNKEVLVSQEISRGTNTDSVRHKLGYYLTPTNYSYVKLYSHKTGELESEGKLVYYESWESDESRRHGVWTFYESTGDTLRKKYEYGQALENTP